MDPNCAQLLANQHQMIFFIQNIFKEKKTKCEFNTRREDHILDVKKCVGKNPELIRSKYINRTKICNGWKCRAGYIRLKLTKIVNGVKIKKHFGIHRLVALAFIPNPNNKPDINHLGDKTDNRACMLEWVTATENNQHSVKYRRLQKWRLSIPTGYCRK